MNKENISRYVRPEDVPVLDKAILEPVLANVSKEMSVHYPELTEADWMEKIYSSLVNGELLLVVDDRRKELGLVRTNEPPFDAIVRGDFDDVGGGVNAADPLGLNRKFNLPMEKETDE